MPIKLWDAPMAGGEGRVVEVGMVVVLVSEWPFYNVCEG